MSDRDPEVDERDSARRRAFRLVHDVQAGDPAAPEALRGLEAAASAAGWDDVVRACVFGSAIVSWIDQADGLADVVERLIAASEAGGDSVMLALGLALRSDEGFSGVTPGASDAREADLARAVALLEREPGGQLERITAHTACGIALVNRWLFELGEAQYEAGLAAGAGAAPGELDFILAPIGFNLAESQLSWACLLYQLGDRSGVAARRAAWRQAVDAAAAFEMVDAWWAELEAFGTLLGAMTGDLGEDDVHEAIAGSSTLESGPRLRPLLDVASLVAANESGRRLGPDELDETIAALDPGLRPHVYDLVLYLAASSEASATSGAGLRYARRQLEAHWAKRIASLGSMQARIDTERLAAERELLSRHARLDDLTGVGNRRALEQFVDEVVTNGVGELALLVLDLDDFKAVNDRFGHLAGDSVLVAVGRTLEDSVGTAGLAVRLGGDEFAALLPAHDLTAADALARRFLASVESVRVGDLDATIPVALSLGVASGSPRDLAALRAAADVALYRAKRGAGESVGAHRLARASR